MRCAMPRPPRRGRRRTAKRGCSPRARQGTGRPTGAAWLRARYWRSSRPPCQAAVRRPPRSRAACGRLIDNRLNDSLTAQVAVAQEVLDATSEATPQASPSSNHDCISSVNPKKRSYNNTYHSNSEPIVDVIPIVKAQPIVSGFRRSNGWVKRRRRPLATTGEASTDRNAAAWLFIPGQLVRIVNLPKSQASMNESHHSEA